MGNITGSSLRHSLKEPSEEEGEEDKVEEGVQGLLVMLERLQQAPPGPDPWRSRGTGRRSDSYHLLPQALQMKGFATVVSKSKRECQGKLRCVMRSREQTRNR